MMNTEQQQSFLKSYKGLYTGKIDGVKGKLTVNAIRAFQGIAGLVKDGKHRTTELIVGNEGEVVGLKQSTTLFRLMTQIQDEVHRFAITFHRDKRSKRQTVSELDSIKGIGEKSKQSLLKHFKSVKRIKEAGIEELAAVVGKSKAEIILKNINEKAQSRK